MCGILGLWHLDGAPVNISAVQSSVNSLRHRGPDDEGYLLVNTRLHNYIPCGGMGTISALGLPHIRQFNGQEFDLALGFRRLAILDLTPAGHQPMSSDNGQLWIVFNGEIYNYLELRRELQSKGYTFHTNTDTEVILVAYAEWGEASLERLNGMWAFAIWDGRHKRLFLARDRFGIKPLYYVYENGMFAFASEIKALVGKHGIPFQPNDKAVYYYVISGVLPSPRCEETFFQKVASLAPGHSLTIDWGAKRLIRQRYWTLPYQAEGSLRSASEVVQAFRELFFDSVRLHLQSDVPVGTCLSGGVDSSSIVCAINNLMLEQGLSTEQIGTRQKTFSAIYEFDAPCNERMHIEKVLGHTDAEGNYVIPTVERLRTEIERLVWYQEEPFQSTSIFAQWCVMHKARECGVTVLLDGQGADEILAGYTPFTMYLSDVMRRNGVRAALGEAHAIQTVTNQSAYRLLGRSVPYLIFGQLPSPLADKLRWLRNWWRTSQNSLHPDFAFSMLGRSYVDWQPAAYQTFYQYLQTMLEETSLPHLLRYEDRNSMAFSIEARVPFLDYRLVQFCFGEASRWRIYQGWTKWVLRKAMEGVVPNDIIWRKDKVGFETPESIWLRQWLYAEPDFFRDGIISGIYLNLDNVRKKVTRWISSGRYNPIIWRWINLELWLRVWTALG